jgi:diacylglycerol kinase family enzyme
MRLCSRTRYPGDVSTRPSVRPVTKARVLLNPYAGTVSRLGLTPDAVRASFAEAGLDVDVEMTAPAAMATRARQAAQSGVPMVVVGGGDGTAGAVAAALLGTETCMAVLPAGTRNHLARDLGMPADLNEAIRAIASGVSRTIDVGEVNGLAFVNNASIGIYPFIVQERDRHLRFGWTKGLATLRAGLEMLRQFRPVRVRIAAEGAFNTYKTPFVFVGNNEYTMSLFAMGQRACLDAATLSLYTANVTRRFGLLRLAALALLGRLDQASDFRQRCVPEAWLDSRWRRLRIALDGEIHTMTPPLHFRVRPAALRVRVPGPA